MSKSLLVPRSHYVRKQIKDHPWSRREEIEALLKVEYYAIHGPKTFGEGMAFHRLKKQASFMEHYGAIKDELDPGWSQREQSQKESRRRKRESQNANERMQARKRDRQARKTWLRLGGVIDDVSAKAILDHLRTVGIPLTAKEVAQAFGHDEIEVQRILQRAHEAGRLDCHFEGPGTPRRWSLKKQTGDL